MNTVKVNFGNFEVSGVRVYFAYTGDDIWVSVGSMSDFIAGGVNMGVSAAYLVAEAQKRLPELTQEKAVQLPYITASGEPSKDYHWYYRIDLDLSLFGLHPAKLTLVDLEIHQPLIAGLKEEIKRE